MGLGQLWGSAQQQWEPRAGTSDRKRSQKHLLHAMSVGTHWAVPSQCPAECSLTLRGTGPPWVLVFVPRASSCPCHADGCSGPQHPMQALLGTCLAKVRTRTAKWSWSAQVCSVPSLPGAVLGAPPGLQNLSTHSSTGLSPRSLGSLMAGLDANSDLSNLNNSDSWLKQAPHHGSHIHISDRCAWNRWASIPPGEPLPSFCFHTNSNSCQLIKQLLWWAFQRAALWPGSSDGAVCMSVHISAHASKQRWRCGNGLLWSWAEKQRFRKSVALGEVCAQMWVSPFSCLNSGTVLHCMQSSHCGVGPAVLPGGITLQRCAGHGGWCWCCCPRAGFPLALKVPAHLQREGDCEIVSHFVQDPAL